MSQDEKDILFEKFLARALSEADKTAFEDLVRTDEPFAQEVALRLAEADAFHRARLAGKADIRRRWQRRRWLSWALWAGLGVLGLFGIIKGCEDRIGGNGGGDGRIEDKIRSEQAEKETTPEKKEDIARDSSLVGIPDNETTVAGTGEPPNIGTPPPAPKPFTLRSKAYYIRIAQAAYSPLKKVQTASEGKPPVPITDEHELAFQGYLDKDSAIVHAYYDRYPNDRRAIEWKARYLFEQGRYEEAALLFARLKTLPKYEDIGAWNELLCYAAQYRTKKKDFYRLEKEVRKTKYKEELDSLLKQIR